MAETWSLSEFIAGATRSMGGGYAGRSIGPLAGYLFGPDFFRKQTYLQVSDTFVATYGKKVWDALNNKTVTFNAIKKVDWGPTVGWRLRTDRGITATTMRSRPVTETGTLPTIDVSNFVGVQSNPRSIATTFGVSVTAQAVSGLEGGIGNQLAVEQEAASRDHIKELNQELLLPSWIRCSAGAAAAFTSSPVARALAVRPGDTVAMWDDSGDAIDNTAATISATTLPNSTTGVVTATGNFNTQPANNDVIFIRSRAGFTSLADIVTQDAIEVFTGTQANEAHSDIYNLTTRTSGTYAAAARIDYNAGTSRDLTLNMVDQGIRAVRQNGGEPKLIIMGLQTYENFGRLLQSQQRFMEVGEYQVGVNDDRTYPGTRAGFQLATYRGIPILPDPDCTLSDNSSGTALAEDIFVLDTDYLELAIMYPTQYLENRDYFQANGLIVRGLFFTLGELRAIRPDVHSRIGDLAT